MNEPTNIWPKLFLIFGLFLISFASYADKYLALDYGNRGKRIRYYPGDPIRVKLLSKEIVGGTLDGIMDSSFVIRGREIQMDSVAMVYSNRKGMKFIGGALVALSALWLGVDMINNAINYGDRGYLISDGRLAPALIGAGTGAVLIYFGTRRTKVYERANFRVFSYDPTPIKEE